MCRCGGCRRSSSVSGGVVVFPLEHRFVFVLLLQAVPDVDRWMEERGRKKERKRQGGVENSMYGVYMYVCSLAMGK